MISSFFLLNGTFIYKEFHLDIDYIRPNMFNPFSYISKMAEIRSLSQEMAVISNRVNQRIKIIVVRLFLNSCSSNRFKIKTNLIIEKTCCPANEFRIINCKHYSTTLRIEKGTTQIE